MTREEAKKLVSELTTEQKEKLYALLLSIKGDTGDHKDDNGRIL